MRKFNKKIIFPLIAYFFLDGICVGAGMGVPIFCIFFGFIVGWYIPRLLNPAEQQIEYTLKQILIYAAITSGITFIFMTVTWGMMVPMFFNPTVDISKIGIPMILYTPKASFIGWLVLMIFISPFLQFLMTVFGGYIRLLRHLYKTRF